MKIRFPRRLLGLILLAAPAAHAGTAPLFTIPEHDLYPENIAHDPRTGDYLLGSMAHPRILRIAADGTYGEFLADPDCGLLSSVGMKADAERRRLWVCSGRFALYADHDAAPAETGVFLFDLDSGKLLRRWTIDQESDYHIFNDLALAPMGEVYATTTLLGRVYRLRADAEEMELVLQLPAGSHDNGITFGPDGKHLYLTVDRTISRLDPATGELTAVAAPGNEALGTDGLYCRGGSLIAVKPRFDQVVRLDLDRDGAAITGAEVLVEGHPGFAYPTTGVLVGARLVLVATSYANCPRTPGTAKQHGDVTILAVDLAD